MTPLLLVVLRAVHILAASFWFGTLLVSGAFLLPAARAAGPAGGQVMRQIVQVRRLPVFVNTAVILTLLTGGILVWWESGGFAADWFATGIGMVWTAGGVLTIMAALLGQCVSAPTARRFGELAAQSQAAGGQPSEATLAEMQRLHWRLLRATQIATLFLALAAIAMAAARYLW